MADESLLLDDATAEAKKRGHRIVVPAHLAIVFAARHADAVASWTDVLAEAERTLSLLPVTYDTPTMDMPASALAPVLKAGDLAVAASAIADAVRANAPVELPDVPGDFTPSMAIPDAHAQWAAAVTPRTDVLGRADVLDQMLDALERKEPVPVLLVGDEGAGRTVMAGALAAWLEKRGMSVVRIDNAAAASDKQLAALTEMLRLASDTSVLFIDDIEIPLGLGYPSGVNGPYLAALRPAMEGGALWLVAVIATPYLARLQGTDRELVEEFALVQLPALDATTLREVVAQQSAGIADYHRVVIPPEVIDAALAPAQDGEVGAHPALALRRLDIAATRSARRSREVEASAPAAVSIGDLPLRKPVERRVDPVALAAALNEQIIGQEAAVQAVSARLAITVAQLDLNPHRPDGVFLFAGPTGVGKTALAIAMAEGLFGSRDALVRIDMSELHSEHTTANLVGSPPGYVGHDNPEGWLTTRIRQNPRCVLLLDEIEKADPQVWNTFLQVFDAGRLTDMRGATADFREVVIVMTTNLGAEVFSSTGSVGFVDNPTSAVADISAVREVLRRTMRPELLNRIDEILVFSPLTPAAAASIARMRADAALELLGSRGYAIEATPELYAVIERVGFSREYGAREVLRTVERLILQPLAALPAGAYRPVVEGDSVRWGAAT
ncbi:MAG: ATP-dependent Clp protease ATP-binding subunit [Actinobacteria bacterium]|nr:ATP-dependent Clp protease ATP-binding subunit [Actinomycetota bacterium]